MKTLIKILIISGLVLSISPAGAQTINWAGLNDGNKNLINANVGFEYAIVYGLGYGHHFKTRIFPILVNAEYSLPSGNQIKDDLKTKVGGQIRWIEYHNFQFSTRIQGVFRRYENNFVRQVNFGSDLAGVVGYYRSKWFVSGEIGFDKAIVSNLKHSEKYKEQYSDVANGWYEPSIGGNFYYGLQTGFSFSKSEINMRIGKILTQDFKTTPMIPYYLQLGYNFKF